MRRFSRLAIISITAFGLIAGSITFNSNPIQGAPTKVEVGPNTSHAAEKLSKMNTKFQPLLTNAQVDVATAVKNAESIYPFTSDATKIHVELHRVTSPFKLLSPEALSKNPKLAAKNAIEDIPSYVISFVGVKPPVASSGPIINSNQVDTRQEFNVVVDATSGVVLYAFSYR